MTAKYKLGIAAAILIALSAASVLSSGARPPSLTAVVVSFHPLTEGYTECVIGLTNSGSPVAYTGYSKDSPLYSFVFPKPGDTTAGGLGWCGTGLGRQTLTKGEGVQFKVQFHSTNAPTHVVVNYQDSRLVERLLARAPGFIRSQIQPRPWHNLQIPLSHLL